MRKTLYPFLLMVVLAVPLVSFAQKTGFDVSSDDPFAFRKAVCTFNRTPLPSGNVTETVPAYLKEHNEHFASALSTLVLKADKTSPGGRHLTFEQNYDGIPVFNSQTKVNLDKRNNIDCIVDNSYSTTNWGLYNLASTAQKMRSHDNTPSFVNTHPKAGVISKNELTIAVFNNQPAIYRLLETFNNEDASYRLFLMDESGTVVYNHDLNSYSGTSIVPASAKPFVPDPLTRAGVYYDTLTPYRDANDSDITELNAQRVPETIMVTYDSLSHIYSLKNDRVEILEFSQPTTTIATSLTPAFEYTRHQPEFEEVNAYYHINNHNAHIAAIGFDSLANFYIRVDAHALSGAENSQFTAGSVPSLYFGDGGVDDAEDADVVVHEYSHGVSNNASPNSNNGFERTALDEGLADYFATSYSRSLYEFRWADMFTWDGHNEYWPGRTAQSTQHYPSGLSSSPHLSGQMWNTALMVIWGQLGRTATDRLMLQTLYSFASNISFPDAARMFIHSDSLLNNGINTCLIANIFYNRGFIDSTYTLPPGCVLTKVGVDDQLNGLQSIKVVNTDGFAFRNEQVMVENMGLALIQKIELYDVTGKQLQVMDNLNQQISYVSGNGFAKGVYLLRVYANNQYVTFKLVKAAQ